MLKYISPKRSNPQKEKVSEKKRCICFSLCCQHQGKSIYFLISSHNKHNSLRSNKPETYFISFWLCFNTLLDFLPFSQPLFCVLHHCCLFLPHTVFIHVWSILSKLFLLFSSAVSSVDTHTGQPGGHQTCQQKKDRAHQTGFTRPQTCKFFKFGYYSAISGTFILLM